MTHMKKRHCSPEELIIKQARVNLKQQLAVLLDYMDTLDRKTWDELRLYKLYNTSLETFHDLYSSHKSTDKEI